MTTFLYHVFIHKLVMRLHKTDIKKCDKNKNFCFSLNNITIFCPMYKLSKILTYHFYFLLKSYYISLLYHLSIFLYCLMSLSPSLYSLTSSSSFLPLSLSLSIYIPISHLFFPLAFISLLPLNYLSLHHFVLFHLFFF